MAEGKNSFVMYADYLENFEMLSDEQAGKLIKHLLAFVNDQNPDDLDPLLKMAALPIKKQMKRDLVKWETIKKKRAEAGRKGGKKRAENSSKQAKQANASSAKQNQTNQAVTVTVTDTVTDTVNVLSKESEIRALAFLKKNYPSRYETDFLMRFSKTINDPQKFVHDFNDTVDQEGLEYTDKVLFARLGKYARNWVQNQNKYNQQQNTNENSGGYPVPVG